MWTWRIVFRRSIRCGVIRRIVNEVLAALDGGVCQALRGERPAVDRTRAAAAGAAAAGVLHHPLGDGS